MIEVVRTTAYLKAIMEVYGKTITGLGKLIRAKHELKVRSTWLYCFNDAICCINILAAQLKSSKEIRTEKNMCFYCRRQYSSSNIHDLITDS